MAPAVQHLAAKSEFRNMDGFFRSLLEDWGPVLEELGRLCLEYWDMFVARALPYMRSFADWLHTHHGPIGLATGITTFCAVYIILGRIGFGRLGVAKGSLAASYQSTHYGGYTPAGGWFSIILSMAMLGILGNIRFLAGVGAGVYVGRKMSEVL